MDGDVTKPNDQGLASGWGFLLGVLSTGFEFHWDRWGAIIQHILAGWLMWRSGWRRRRERRAGGGAGTHWNPIKFCRTLPLLQADMSGRDFGASFLCQRSR